MTDLLTEVRFWAQIIGDARRTIVCPPEYESRIKGWIDARAMGGILTVTASPFVLDGQIIVIDEQGINAANDRVLLQALNNWSRGITP